MDEIMISNKLQENEGQNSVDIELSNQPIIQFPIDGILMCKLCGTLCLVDKEVFTHLKDVHGKSVTSENVSENFSKLIPVNSSDDNITFQVVDSAANVNLVQINDNSPKRRRGRPRKSEQSHQVKEIETKTVKHDKIAVIDANGKYNCSRCTKMFSKERHYLGHRCQSVDAENEDFGELETKELEECGGADQETEDVALEVDLDSSADYKIYLSSGSRQGNRKKKQLRNEKDEEQALNKNFNLNENIVYDPCVENVNLEVTSNTIHAQSVPVFTDDDERKGFEENISNVDLSCVDYLFRTKIVQQELNDLASKITKANNELEVFSCTLCKKFFKTLSHVRLHCLTHTDLKPFKCPRCPYASNAKSNLYTHMRKHTGNLFKCSICNFKNCNRSHMAEHEATHSTMRHVCRICSNDYNTIKSLANHVRKYHSSNKQGREYLTTFSLKPQQNTLLHQCHICNRKFKKKFDRDRHLNIHIVNTTKDKFRCEMCNFTTVRRNSLETHFRKHRIIYTCCQCESRFLSSVHLQEHLHSHISMTDIKSIEEMFDFVQTSSENSFSSLFESSVKSSWYLLEPDGVLNGYKFSNIPTELITLNSNNETNNEKLISQDERNLSKNINDDGDDKIGVLELLKGLNYQQLTMEIYNKIRETFGNEECRFCGRLYHSPIDHDVHLRTHNIDRPFKCSQCQYSSITKDNLKRHIETIHDKRKLRCDQCEFTTSNRTSLWHHQQTHREKPMECPECKKNFGNSRKLQSHIICAHSHFTKKEINKIIGLNRRVQSRLGRRSYKCPYCDRVFLRSNTDLQKHIWVHEGVKPFKCSECSHSCRSRNNLNIHMLRHSNDKPHICAECGKSYKSKAALKWHSRVHGVTSVNQEIPSSEIKKRFICQYCKFSSYSQNAIKTHYLRRHKTDKLDKLKETEKIPEKTESEGSKMYKCINCEFIFENIAELRKHLKVSHQLNLIDFRGVSCNNLEVMAKVCDEDINNIAVSSELADESYELVQVETEEGTSLARIPTSTLQDLQMAGVSDTEMDMNTASAVRIIQQIIEQSSFGQNGNDFQQIVTINSDSLIIENDDKASDITITN